MFEQSSFNQLGENLARALRSSGAARIGDTSVVSLCVHAILPSRPDEVRVMARSDAGRAFYGRELPGQVLHLDVFHRVGEADHISIAAAVRYAVFNSGLTPSMASFLADMTDIQTGTGGGRLSGSLRYGSGKGVRRAHMNHVHLAVWRMEDRFLGTLVAIVGAVEDELVRMGLELRKIARAILDFSQGPPADLSSYSSGSDSYLRGAGAGGSGLRSGLSPVSTAAGSVPPVGVSCNRSAGAEARSGAEGGFTAPSSQWAPAAAEIGGGKPVPVMDRSLTSAPEPEAEEFAHLQTILDLLEEFETPYKLGETLRALRDCGLVPGDGRGLQQVLQALDQRQIEVLQRTGVAVGTLVQRGLRLTPKGKLLVDFLSEKDREVEWLARRALARLPRPTAVDAVGRPVNRKGVAPKIHRAGRGASAVTVAERAGDAEFALIDTVVNACRRTLSSRRAGQTLPVRFLYRDLRFYKAVKSRMPDICLVIDGSASMGGKRIRAAKYVARHLVLRTRSRTSVVIFQENSAELKMPFTRSIARTEECLERIRAQGLTPLARGLILAKEVVSRRARRTPYVFIITDGIPTVSLWSSNPTADALKAAEELGRCRANFACIGLEPNRHFLEQLAQKLKARCYVMEEMEKEKMASLFRRSGV